MNIKKHIPNLFTLGNLFCGCLAIYYVIEYTSLANWQSSQIAPGHTGISFACILLLISMVLDFFDGFIARLLNVQGELGKQLDSLADMVSFGVAPGFILSALIIQSDSHLSNSETYSESMVWNAAGLPEGLSIIALIIPLMAAMRLAKFNIDQNQSENFIGLPTPAMTLFVIGVFTGIVFQYDIYHIFDNRFVLIFTTIALAFLMVAPIPLFGFKFKNFTWADNWFRYVLLIFAIPLLIWLKLAALAIIIIIYILMSVIFKKSFHHPLPTQDS